MHDAAFGMLRADFFEKGGIFVRIGCGRGRGFFGSPVIIIQICDRKRAIKMIDIIHDDVHRDNPDSVFLCQLSGDIRAASVVRITLLMLFLRLQWSNILLPMDLICWFQYTTLLVPNQKVL